MTKTVYAFAGKRSSGKSTASQVLIDLGFTDLKFADPLKNMLRSFYSHNGVFDPVEIERRIEGDLKEEVCATISQESFSEGTSYAMMEAFYVTCGLSPEDAEAKVYGHRAEQPCEWLSGLTPDDAVQALDDEWFTMLGDSDSKTPRYAMQTLGTEWREMLSTSLWSDIFVKRVNSGAFGDLIVCSDYRFPHESVALKEVGAYTYMIKRPHVQDTVGSHTSETSVDNLPTMPIFNNNRSIEDLRRFVSDLVEANKVVAGLDMADIMGSAYYTPET